MYTLDLQEHNVTLPALIVHGSGDPLEGCVRLVAAAAASAGRAQGRLLVLHLPRIEVCLGGWEAR